VVVYLQGLPCEKAEACASGKLHELIGLNYFIFYFTPPILLFYFGIFHNTKIPFKKFPLKILFKNSL
jgi:hypothetical protein